MGLRLSKINWVQLLKKSIAPTTPAPTVGGNIDNEAIAILTEFCKLTEKLALVAYPDPLAVDGKPVTNGFGSTQNRQSQRWQVGDKITENEANYLILRDVTEAYTPMSTIPHWDIMTAHQRAALADLNFNEGYAYGDGDHETLDRALFNCNWRDVGIALQLYDNNDELGLSRRRYAEWLMFRHARSPDAAYREAFSMDSVASILELIT